MSILEIIALLMAGAVSGWINVLAGGGSFLTMALLMGMGLDANQANGTIRPGILAQNLLAVLLLKSTGLIRASEVWRWSPAVVLGAVLGSQLASSCPPEAFRRWMIPLVLVGCYPLLQDLRGHKQQQAVLTAGRAPDLYFFLAGMYGGLIQAGVGFWLLGAARHAGFDLRRGNALKVALTLMLGLPSMVVFAHAGQIDLSASLWLALGTLAGSYVGADWLAFKSLRWIKAALLLGLLVFVLHLAMTG